MMYLTKEELVKNIAEQTERASAVIEHTDFNSAELNPNSIIVPFLCNIFDSALIVTALEEHGNSENDCHRKALNLVMCSLRVNANTKKFIKQIQDARQKYSFDCADIPFSPDDCLDFLNAYDCFMFDFIKNSETVKNMNSLEFVSFRNMVEKLLKRNMQGKTENSDGLPGLLEQNNRLLSELLNENRMIRQNLDELLRILKSNGGIKNE